jgi:hypothetical protein
LARAGDSVSFSATPDAGGRYIVRDFRDKALAP